jgi:hypothetical protein
MTLTTEQCRALIEAIAVASSIDALATLRCAVRREHGLDVQGGFVELLIELRREKLERSMTRPSRIA